MLLSMWKLRHKSYYINIRRTGYDRNLLNFFELEKKMTYTLCSNYDKTKRALIGLECHGFHELLASFATLRHKEYARWLWLVILCYLCFYYNRSCEATSNNMVKYIT